MPAGLCRAAGRLRREGVRPGAPGPLPPSGRLTTAGLLLFSLAYLELAEPAPRDPPPGAPEAADGRGAGRSFPLHALVALLFGLVHGCGFASALLDLGLSGAHLAWALLGFNLGVEAGQLVVVLALVLLYLLGARSATVQRRVFPAIHVVTVGLALFWLGARLP